jgi:hypothetical protein
VADILSYTINIGGYNREMQNILREKTTLNEKEKEYETLKNMQ